jgi:hypothetical protein
MARFGSLDTQYFDASGEPLVNGKIYFYESGTTTAKTTYADINNTIPNTNPVLLDASGRQPNIFFEGVAKATLTNNGDTQIVSRDPVGETATNFGDEWVSSRIYGTNSVVIASDGQYYRSLSAGNQNNNPVTTSGFWSLLYSVEWNAGINYGVGATVTYDTLQYQAIQGSNLNHAPNASPTWWVPLEFVWSATSTYAINQNVVGTDGILYTSLQATNLNHIPASSATWWVGTSAAAAASATAAAASATAALASEVAAQTAETGAQTAQTAAELAETNAQTAQTAAELAETNAETAETNAETAETNAATSASNSATSATASATSATASAASATAAATSETNAATSETNAATSETNAATSETNAANSATAAATSATDSANSATASASSATAAAGSATAASGSATAAATSATNAATSATNAATAEAGAEAALDEFTDIYLGSFASDPTTDNDGNPLQTGALYFNTTIDKLKVYDGSAWLSTAFDSSNVAITGGTIDGTTIGGTTSAAGTFTTLAGTTSVVAASDMTLTSGSIVSASGAISFGNENLSTTGTLASGALTVTGLAKATKPGIAGEFHNTTAAGANNTILDLRWNTSTTAGHSGDIDFKNIAGLATGRISSEMVSGSTVDLVLAPFNSSISEGLRVSALNGVSTTGTLASGALTVTGTGSTTGNFTVGSAGSAGYTLLGIQGATGGALDWYAGATKQWEIYNAAGVLQIYDVVNATPRADITTTGFDLYGNLAVTGTGKVSTGFAVGGATPGTGGIAFPATAVAVADANTLDDYEEGTFTPTLGGTTTYTVQSGKYTKIGDRVFFTIQFAISAIGTGSTTQISGLPFTTGGIPEGATVAYFSSSATNIVSLYAQIPQSNTVIDLYSQTAAASGLGANAIFTGSTSLQINGHYDVA